ncbi:class I SAM-dependent methyltransferase [bacterium CPR1]|nr:class I SAM-dependent methyltransferase [bacterium CPR1]
MNLRFLDRETTQSRQLAYFETLFSHLDGETAVALAFSRNVHWGFWEHPRQASRKAEDFAAAAERMTVEVCRTARIGDQQAVLDVGCGFGGTLASLNERFCQMRLTGLNIDPRQIARARATVHPRPGNQIEFVEGSASSLPFPNQSFDVVVVVEAIFNFPDRVRFFAEAHRVLRPGGTLAISDFVPSSWIFPIWLNVATSYYGNCDMRYSLGKYRRLARDSGFRPVVERDVTVNTLPTYDFLETLEPAAGAYREAAKLETRILGWMSRWRLLTYMLLAFERV